MNTRRIWHIFEDHRIGGVTRYTGTYNPGELVQLPSEFLKCCMFIGPWNQNPGAITPSATVFVVTKKSTVPDSKRLFIYLVTAKHVIEKLKNSGSQQCGLRFNITDDNPLWLPIDINSWVNHPSDSIDISILSWHQAGNSLGRRIDQAAIPVDSCITDEIIRDENVGIGDEILMTGLFTGHHGIFKNIPILRSGIISAMPDEPILTQFGKHDYRKIIGYLAELRSWGGYSGSPVYINLGGPRYNKDGIINYHFQPKLYLLGVLHGHWDKTASEFTGNDDSIAGKITEPLNTGIGIVTPSKYLFELLESEDIRMLEKVVDDEDLRNNSATPDGRE